MCRPTLFRDGVCRRAIDITSRECAAIRQVFLLDLVDRMRSLTASQEIMAES